MYDWAEFRHFRYLLTILEKQGIRAAAEVLHTAQPNLSVQARQFQENASVRLFRRTRSGRIRPTEAGIAFVSLARFLLETRDEVIEALIAIERGTIGPARFGCSPFVEPALFRALCNLNRKLFPGAILRPTHGDVAQLTEEVVSGTIDTALVILPVKHPDLHVEPLRRDQLVVCLPKNDPLTRKAVLQVNDLEDKLTVFYHSARHSEAHAALFEQLNEAGIGVKEYSRASHPSEMQMLVKEGHGFALLREGIVVDEGLTTRKVAGVDWTIETAAIYHAERHAKTVPILIKQLRREVKKEGVGVLPETLSVPKGPRRAEPDEIFPVQLSLLK